MHHDGRLRAAASVRCLWCNDYGYGSEFAVPTTFVHGPQISGERMDDFP